MKLRQYLCLVAVIAGTWGTPGAVAEEPALDEAPVFYPPAPNPPRLQYLRKYSSAFDMSAKESGFRDFIFGGADKEEQAINKPYGVAVHDGAIFAADTRGGGYVIFDFVKGTKVVLPRPGRATTVDSSQWDIVRANRRAERMVSQHIKALKAFHAAQRPQTTKH